MTEFMGHVDLRSTFAAVNRSPPFTNSNYDQIPKPRPYTKIEKMNEAEILQGMMPSLGVKPTETIKT